MIQKLTHTIPCDNTGVFLIKVIQIYKKKIGLIGNFGKGSIRDVKLESKLKKKKKIKFFFIRSVYLNKFKDYSFFKGKYNNILLLKKRLNPRGSTTQGFISYNIKRKKLLKSFSKII